MTRTKLRSKKTNRKPKGCKTKKCRKSRRNRMSRKSQKSQKTRKGRGRTRKMRRKMKGGVNDPFDADESAIMEDDNDEHNISLGTMHTDELDISTPDSADAGNTTIDSGLSVSNPNLSISSFSMDETEGEVTTGGGKRKRRRNNRRYKKGGEMPQDFNPNQDKENPITDREFKP